MVTQTHIPTRAWFELILLGMIWGAVFVSLRIALDELSVLHLVTHRVGWAALILWVYLIIRRQKMPLDPQTLGAFAVMGVLNNILPFSLLTWGQLYIEAGLASIFNATTAIFGVLVAALFFADERLNARKLFGVGLGFLGVATAIGLDNLTRFDPRSVAQLAVLGATLCYALAGVWAKKRLSHLSPPVASTGMLSASFLILLPIAYWLEGPIPFSMSGQSVIAILFSAVIATAFAYLLYYRILAMAGSGNLMLVTLLVPPVAILLGAILLGESLNVNAFIGFGLLALGLVVLDGRLYRRLKRRSV